MPASEDGAHALSIAVNIDGDNTVWLELADGDDAFDTARRFCIRHGIEYSLYPTLAHAILKQKTRRQTM